MSIEALSMVLNHSQARGAAKIVLLGIANHLGPDADEGAWPSQDRLAAYANVTDRGVRKAVTNLIELGELRVAVADGHSRDQYKPNRYWITLECPEDCDGSMWHRRVELSDTQGGTFEQSGRNFSTDRVEPQFLLISKETEENRQRNMFDEFWEVYPKRVGRKAAATKWRTAIKTANPEQIIEAAKRYRDDPERSPKFTANPETWLNQERWLDEPTEAPKTKTGPVTVMDLYADEPCKHGDPMGEARCPLCRRQ